MDLLLIFVSQLFLSLVVYALIAKWYVVPWLADKPLEQVLMALIFPHALRHVGLAFLVPGLVAGPLPASFANAAAFGDLLSGLLALACLFALRQGWRYALPLVWVFNVIGTVDLVNALRQAEAVPNLGTAWLIPTFLVPLLLVTHGLIFARLVSSIRRPLQVTTS